MAFSPRCFLWVFLSLATPLFLPSMAEDPPKPSLNASRNGESPLLPFYSVPPRSPFSPRPNIAPFRPSIAVIVGVLTTMFSITFLLLLYAKHCKRGAGGAGDAGGSNPNSAFHTNAAHRNSGIDRGVIESLPIFRFGSLQGEKEGLECAVCLCRFEISELLRLLPKCKHAFHVECVDTWLDAHSTCPLCRYRVDPEDVLLHTPLPTPRTSAPAPPPRVSGRHSSAGERGSAADNDLLRGRGSLDSWNSRRKKTANSGGKGRKDGQLPVQGDRHRLEHRIIISSSGEGEEEEAERLRRWSDVQAAESLYLKSEMLLEGESGSGVINERSVSEITGMSRYRGNNGGKGKEERERVVKRWLAWISQSQHPHPAVQSPPPSLPI